MQILNCVVRYPGGQPRTSASGRPFVSALFSDPATGTEYRVFAPPEGQTTTALQQLRPGDPAKIALDSKGKAHYVIPDGDQQQGHPMGFHPTPSAVPQSVPQVQHQQQPAAYPAPVPAAAPADPAIAAADLLARIYGRLIQQGVPEGVAGPMSSTAFIQLNGRGR